MPKSSTSTKTENSPYRFFCLWQAKNYVNMPTHGWDQAQFREHEWTAQRETFFRMKRFAYVEDCATGDVVFSSLDLLRSMHVARTNWPARDKIYRLLKDAKPKA